ncbi:hypothetical protein H4R21_003561 [Coemansia helicoidea]|uniref:Uncharacterized protein n=1 Tax=Coemansia helicoidea TaxID=1286919 RepID=A0ACC1L308_9FUNG|nr:hypothetical protein H4R21_003561 [Coemansia helicoidea]
MNEDMYPGINAFVKFAADSVSRHTRGRDGKPRARSIVPFEKTDVKPDGADDLDRVDHMVTGCPNVGPVTKPDYAMALCLIEAKYSQNDQTDAYEQLARYSRNIYGSQPHRRFLWGLTVCGTLVRVCLLGNDKIYASKAVDVSEPVGREQLVGLFVNWSLCESTRVGYDPTMWRDENGEWTIKVFQGGKSHAYSGLKLVFQSYSLLGRRTRCFVGTTKVGGAEKQVLIKDCWPRALKDSAGRPRDEVAFLRHIKDTLGADKNLDDKYPVLGKGGAVRVPGRAPADVDHTTTADEGVAIGDDTTTADGGVAIGDDTTTKAFVDLDLPDSAPPDSAPPDSAPPDCALPDPLPLRQHKRITMIPVGESLLAVNSPDELIVAVCDAMEAHTAIVRRCGILHRDISFNNILVRRTGDMVGGMLIDFDNAIRLDVEHVAGQPDRTGTLPFISVGNLEESLVARTSLDDWESCIYLLCWLGASGVNDDDQERYKNNPMRRILKWRNGDEGDIAEVKRNHMTTEDAFESILAEFINDEQYDGLRGLVKALHETLFFNAKVSPLCHGSHNCVKALRDLHNEKWSLKDFLDANVGVDVKADPRAIDPFARRAKFADEIADDLMKTLFEACNKAKARLRAAQLETIAEGSSG